MKMKIRVFAGVCMAAALLAGCSRGISNDYVEISAYKGIKVEQLADRKVTDQDVEDQIEYEMDEQAEYVSVTDRAAQTGDTVNIDYVGKLNGVAFDGGTAAGYDLELGSGKFIAGFEDGVVGHTIGETFDLDLTFPEDYGNADLAGQAVVFTVTLNSISEKQVQELAPEYISSVTDNKASTLDEYRAYLKEDMQNTYNDYLEANLRENAWTAVLKNTEVTDYPEERIKELKEELQKTYENMAASYGMEFEDYLAAYMNTDPEKFEQQLDSQVKDEVKEELVTDLIIEKERIDLSEEKMQSAYEKLSKQWGFESLEDMQESVEESGAQDYLDNQARTHLVKQWLADNCKPVIED